MIFLWIAVFLLTNFQFVTAQDWLQISKDEILALRNYLYTFEDDKSDIVFLLDTSRSLTSSDFDEEKKFITNFLNEINVQMKTTRVEVIPFGYKASQFITQISEPQSTKNMCSFNEKFAGLAQSINGWSTNMKQAFELAWKVCLNNGLKREPSVKTVVILLTDGKWNVPYNDPSPVSWAEMLRDGKVEVFAIGVGNINYDQLKQVVDDPDKQAFYLKDFDELADLATYIRGGNLVIFVTFFLTIIGLKSRKEVMKKTFCYKVRPENDC